jgi:hypothetical protein
MPHNLTKFDLDYIEDGFEFGRHLYMLEVTARSSFSFQRLYKEHLQGVVPVKYIQIQMYLNSPEIRSMDVHECVCVIKNKNTSELYEEGIILHPEIITATVEKLRQVNEAVARGEVLHQRCTDWHKYYCRYHKLCVPDVETEISNDNGSILDGSTLTEAEHLTELAVQWKEGSPMLREGKELVEDARLEFQDIIEQYGVKGIRIAGVKAVMIDSHSRSVDYDWLQKTYPEAYEACVNDEPKRYVRVTGEKSV